jgi:(1->4)-alpha-D-glucan 1-alpha-D-glucosylmutase
MKAVPSATYRIQLHRGFSFDDAAAVSGYLAELGVTHVYCSPYLQAARGSTHGYDVIDHTRPNVELGGEEGFRRFAAALKAAGLGQVLDVVPNHMAISTAENWWWADVLENGPSSHFASYFDVEWEPPEARLRNTVLIPILSDHYGRVLEAGELQIVRRGAEFHVRYGENTYPVSPSSLGPLLGRAARQAGSDALGYLADAFSSLPRPTATDRASVRRRHRDKAVLREQLRRLLDSDRVAATALDQAVAEMNADPDALHALLDMQNYRLAWWRSADPRLDSNSRTVGLPPRSSSFEGSNGVFTKSPPLPVHPDERYLSFQALHEIVKRSQDFMKCASGAGGVRGANR